MGSSQSSAASSSFSVDANGNITRKIVQDNKQQDRENLAHQSSSKNETNQTQANHDNSSKQESSVSPTAISDSSNTTHVQQLDISPPLAKQQQLSKAGIDLKEAGESICRLKEKFKSADMVGKRQSVFEEFEREVQQCYIVNKNQSAKCSKLINEYQSYVDKQRSQLLGRSLANNVPLVTTVLVIITCLLLHVTMPVTCFGAMSIDLGSEWMKVGLVAPSVQMDIVLNAQSQRKTAMAIAFANGERFVGDAALDVASKYPEKTFTHFLDLVGKTIDHESVKHYKKRFPYANITSHEPNSTSILLNHPDGFSFTPLELIAMMIQHAHDQVTNRLNSDEPAYDVVITVPPFFDAVERRVIIDAARLLGLNVLRLTNVNSAFTLSYGIFRHKDYQPEISENKTTILFFDQGASHTSATLADYHLIEQFDEITGMSKNESLPTVTIRAQAYDRYLGGFDMQLRLRDHLMKSFSKSTKIDESRIVQRSKSMAKLLKESGRVKKILSANTDHVVRVENVIDDRDLKLPIARKEYEDFNKEYLEEKIIQLLNGLFEMSDVSRDEKIESVIIVGGNTRTPKIQQVLLDYFKLSNLGKSINADEGAALAALYQAASLGRGFRVKKFALEEFGEERKRFDPSKIVTTTTTTTPQPVLETEAPTESPETATETSSDLPKVESSTTVPPVDGTPLSTEASSTTTTEPTTTTQDPNSIYSETEILRVRNILSDLRDQDFIRLQRLSLRNSLESLLSEGKEKLSDDDENLKDQKEELQKVIDETYTWLEDGEKQETDNVTLLADKFNHIHGLMNPPPPPPPPPHVEL